ncbi:Protein transport protein SEC20 [Spathaspora sp. JA1]|nr:Protein transport protein SEC20 [Spathaspora sp. JA1]
MSQSIYYKKLDNLQHEIYTSLDSLTTYQESEFDSTPTNDLKHLHQQLLKYKDYLRICKHKLISNEDFHTFELYQLRYLSFKSKLREILMENHGREAQLAHEFRIKQFGLDKPVESQNSANNTNGLTAREQLFGNAKSRESAKVISDLSVNQQVAHHNKQITQSLQTSRQLLSATILQSELNLDSLDQQTKDLNKLNEGFIQFSTLLNRSQQIVKFIEKQDKSDRQRIYMAGAFFLACCCWVIYRRVLRRPIQLMLWSFFKIIGIYSWVTGSKNDATISTIISSSIIEMVSTVLETVSSEAATSTIEKVSSSTSSSIIDTVEKVVETIGLDDTISQLEEISSRASSTIIDTVLQNTTLDETISKVQNVSSHASSSIIETVSTILSSVIQTSSIESVIMDKILDSSSKENTYVQAATSLISSVLDATTYIEPERIIDEL